jgi:hypothetical protein
VIPSYSRIDITTLVILDRRVRCRCQGRLQEAVEDKGFVEDLAEIGASWYGDGLMSV